MAVQAVRERPLAVCACTVCPSLQAVLEESGTAGA